MQSICILGRQPALGIVELESLIGAENITKLPGAAVLDVPVEAVPFSRLGGSIKLAKVLTLLDTLEFKRLTEYINKTLPQHLGYIPEGKIKFGLSCFGIKTTPQEINKATLRIKKTIKSAGRSVRVVPNNELTLGSAQVIHNQMTSPLGMELLLVAYGSKTILAQTVIEQDIEAYAARDHGRPKRDSKVGMLPPKLAQIIINLAHPTDTGIILDPFCGTGVILQEAGLIGLGAHGSDLEERMIHYSRDNIQWLEHTWHKTFDWHVEVADATSTTIKSEISAIACETYLGRPFSTQPDPKTLQEVMQDVNLIHKRFLQNVCKQTSTGFRLCIAVPAWHLGSTIKHLKVLDNLEELGYNRIDFVHAKREELIYHRPGQIVGRELVVLERT